MADTASAFCRGIAIRARIKIVMKAAFLLNEIMIPNSVCVGFNDLITINQQHNQIVLEAGGICGKSVVYKEILLIKNLPYKTVKSG